MKNKANAGFTLPEIIIGMMILLLIFGAVTGLLSSGLTASKYNLSKANSLSAARNAVNQIEEIARYASKIDSPTTSSGSGNELQLETSDGSVYRVYIAKDNNEQNAIFIDKNSSNIKKLANGMIANGGIVFSRDTNDPTMLLIEVTINDASFSGSPNTSISSRVKLLNLSS